jgi:ribosomal protein L7Ae-like RNA K-turn-binding protein
MSEDISANTRQSLQSICSKQNIPWIVMGSKYELGNSVGKAYRVAVTVNDEGLAQAILKALESREKPQKVWGWLNGQNKST